jgi:hypothetical protein
MRQCNARTNRGRVCGRRTPKREASGGHVQVLSRTPCTEDSGLSGTLRERGLIGDRLDHRAVQVLIREGGGEIPGLRVDNHSDGKSNEQNKIRHWLEGKRGRSRIVTFC